MSPSVSVSTRSHSAPFIEVIHLHECPILCQPPPKESVISFHHAHYMTAAHPSAPQYGSSKNAEGVSESSRGYTTRWALVKCGVRNAEWSCPAHALARLSPRR